MVEKSNDLQGLPFPSSKETDSLSGQSFPTSKGEIVPLRDFSFESDMERIVAIEQIEARHYTNSIWGTHIVMYTDNDEKYGVPMSLEGFVAGYMDQVEGAVADIPVYGEDANYKPLFGGEHSTLGKCVEAYSHHLEMHPKKLENGKNRRLPSNYGPDTFLVMPKHEGEAVSIERQRTVSPLAAADAGHRSRNPDDIKPDELNL